ncbi:type III secretion system inner rod subunit SctI [Morganella morganii]|nr:EscI/YscI/HrpB family type III secretion system inner rod protein [Morganella morganii]
MIPALSTHTLPLSDLAAAPENNSVLNLPSEQETEQLKTLFGDIYRTMKQDTDNITALYNDNAITSPDVLLQTQLSLAKIHFREELLAKTVGKVSQNIDMIIKSQ